MPTILPQSCIWSIEPGRFRALLAAMLVESPRMTVGSQARPRNVPRETFGGVEIVGVTGFLDKAESGFLEYFGGTAYKTIGRQVSAALADPEVGAILLRVDSPGGSVDGLAELGDQLFEARGRKSLVAQVTGMAASAAYYLASQADKVYAGRMDLVGSIGTVLPMDDMHQMYAAMGVEALTFATGPFKGAGWPGTEITPEQREYFQGITDAFYADFLAVVRRGRKVKGLDAVADGRVFLATEAKENGLIDGIRTLEKTLSGLANVKSAPRRARASLDILLAEAETPSRRAAPGGIALAPSTGPSRRALR